MATGAIEDLSLAELLDEPTEVASRVDLPGRESPGVLTVLSREDILRTGARDLAQLLAFVPGFGTGVDVQGSIGPSTRGLWGQEGKVLVLVDGHEMNELAYSTTPIVNHLPLELAEQITIIRGPGSTVYGGFAELTVIDIVTRAAAGKGLTASGRYEATTASDTLLQQTAGVAYGHQGSVWRIGALAWGGEGNLTDRVYVDAYGTETPMAGANKTRPVWLAVDASTEDFRARVALDGFTSTMVDAFDAVLEAPTPEGFQGAYAQFNGDLHPADGLTVTPHASFKLQQPWRNTEAEPDSVIYLDLSVLRSHVGVDATYDVNDHVTALAGGLFQLDYAFPRSVELWGDPVTIVDGGVFSEVVGQWSFATVSAGVRLEYNPRVGPMFGPRIALTRAFGDDGHVKVLAARAFRAPGLYNLLGGSVSPEAVDTIEAEVGVALGKRQYVTLNAYDTTMRNPIVYFYEVDDLGNESEGYTNEERTGTRGVEAQYRIVTKRVDAWATYSLYSAAGREQVPNWVVPDHPGMLQGMATHKGTFVLTTRPIEGLALSPNVIAQSRRFAYAGYDSDEELVPSFLPGSVLVGADVRYAIGDQGFGLGVGAHDLLDQAPSYAQPYDGGHPPLPGAGRSFYLRFGWEPPVTE